MELTLTRKQTDFYEAIFDDTGYIRSDNELTEFHYFGGFGSGKTRIVCTTVHQICLQYPNSHGVFIRNTYGELKDSVIPQYHSYMNYEGYTFIKTDRIAEYQNGTRLDFRAFDEPQKILSNEYDFIAFSQLEEINQELFLQTLGRNRRKIGGLPKNIILGEGNPASGWVKERLKDNPLPKNVFLIEATTKDNPYLPPEYESNLRANYPDFWCRRYLDGEWANLDEMVFNEFSDSNIIELVNVGELPKSYKKRIFMDYGWVNPTAILWAYVDYDGRLVIYDEWFHVKQLPDEIFKAHMKHEPAIGRCPVVVDYAIKNIKSGTETRRDKTLWDDLMELGMSLISSNKDKMRNIIDANSLFKQKRLLITRNCVNLIKEIRNYKWKRLKLGEEKNHPEEPIKKDDHGIDAMLYGIADLEELKSTSPKDIEYRESLKAKTIEMPQRDWRDLG